LSHFRKVFEPGPIKELEMEEDGKLREWMRISGGAEKIVRKVVGEDFLGFGK
jgi:hypothetical protein